MKQGFIKWTWNWNLGWSISSSRSLSWLWQILICDWLGAQHDVWACGLLGASWWQLSVSTCQPPVGPLMVEEGDHRGEGTILHTGASWRWVGDGVRGAQTVFAEKYWLFTWVHGLTKNKKSLASLPPFCICLCSTPFSLQSLCNHLGFQKGQNW
jgi:hypothetical protein